MDSPGFESRQKQKNFFSSDSKAHPVSYLLDTRSSFSQTNCQDSAVDYLTPSSAEVRRDRLIRVYIYIYIYIYIYMAG